MSIGPLLSELASCSSSWLCCTGRGWACLLLLLFRLSASFLKMSSPLVNAAIIDSTEPETSALDIFAFLLGGCV